MPKLRLETAERDDLLARLEEMPGFLEAALGALSSTEAVVRRPNGAFSPVEQCWHLADLEREGYGERIGRLTLSLAEGLRAFRAARAATLAKLRSIRGDQWQRRGRQEGVGPVALCDLPAMLAEHDASHRREIEAWTRALRSGEVRRTL